MANASTNLKFVLAELYIYAFSIKYECSCVYWKIMQCCFHLFNQIQLK